MKLRARDIIITLFFMVFLFTAATLGFIYAINDYTFEYDLYLELQEGYIECNENYIEQNEKANEIKDLDFYDWTEEEIFKVSNVENYYTTCNTIHVSTNKDEYPDMAMVAYEAVNEQDDYEMLFSNGVFTTSEEYAAALNQPREYLFFSMNEEKSVMMAIIVYPTSDGYDYYYAWDWETARDEDKVLNLTPKLLTKYSFQAN